MSLTIDDRKTIGDLQYEINTNKIELANLKYNVERNSDFWEWYENEYQETQNELWDKFEAWEDKQDGKN